MPSVATPTASEDCCACHHHPAAHPRPVRRRARSAAAPGAGSPGPARPAADWGSTPLHPDGRSRPLSLIVVGGERANGRHLVPGKRPPGRVDDISGKPAAMNGPLLVSIRWAQSGSGWARTAANAARPNCLLGRREHHTSHRRSSPRGARLRAEDRSGRQGSGAPQIVTAVCRPGGGIRWHCAGLDGDHVGESGAAPDHSAGAPGVAAGDGWTADRWRTGLEGGTEK